MIAKIIFTSNFRYDTRFDVLTFINCQISLSALTASFARTRKLNIELYILIDADVIIELTGQSTLYSRFMKSNAETAVNKMKRKSNQIFQTDYGYYVKNSSKKY